VWVRLMGLLRSTKGFVLGFGPSRGTGGCGILAGRAERTAGRVLSLQLRLNTMGG
jgi:hypothetical protein